MAKCDWGKLEIAVAETYSNSGCWETQPMVWIAVTMQSQKANIVLSFCCKRELLKCDPVSWSLCLLTLPERCHSVIALTQAHFHLCFHRHEHAWPAIPVEHATWASEHKRHGQAHSWGPGPYAEPHGPWHSACYRAVGGGRVTMSGAAQKAGYGTILLCLIGNDFDAFWSLSAKDLLKFLQSFGWKQMGVVVFFTSPKKVKNILWYSWKATSFSCILITPHNNPVLICAVAAVSSSDRAIFLPKQAVFKDRWSVPKSASMTTPLIIKFTELVIKKNVLHRLLLAGRYKSSLTINPLYMITFNAAYARTTGEWIALWSSL